MSIIRVEKQRKYTCVSNVPLQDTRLSLKARGLIEPAGQLDVQRQRASESDWQ